MNIVNKNVGKLDKVIRIVVGLVLFSLLYFLEKPLGYIGLIGAVPLLTALVGYCPLYKIVGLSTCPLNKKK
jgi:hypothetical protein